MMHHSPAMKIVSMISWLLTSLAALAVGLAALGANLGKSWDLWGIVGDNMPALMQPLQYAVGIAGLLSLIMWFGCVSGGCYSDHQHGGKK